MNTKSPGLRGEARAGGRPGDALPMDVRFMAWRKFLGAYKAVLPQVEQALQARRDLPLTWYDVLFQLNEAPAQRLLVQDLADAVLLSPSGIPGLVDRIEAAGLVAREGLPEDERGRYIVRTPDGYKRLIKAIPVVTRAIRKCFADHLSQEDADVLVQILGRVQDRPTGQDLSSGGRVTQSV